MTPGGTCSGAHSQFSVWKLSSTKAFFVSDNYPLGVGAESALLEPEELVVDGHLVGDVVPGLGVLPHLKQQLPHVSLSGIHHGLQVADLSKVR